MKLALYCLSLIRRAKRLSVPLLRALKQKLHAKKLIWKKIRLLLLQVLNGLQELLD